MNKDFLQYLVDPKTGEELVLEISEEKDGLIVTGKLISPSNQYQIIRGVPRFAGYNEADNYTNSFGWEWNKWGRVQFEAENIDKPMAGWTKNMWEKITGEKHEDLSGQIIADFGCGSGRFVDIAKSKGALVVGLDYSSAVEEARNNFAGDKNVLIVQADILHSPLRPGSMDGTFSIGVLHHTNDSEQGFGEMAKVTKSGGWCAVSVYGQGGYYDARVVNLYRRLFNVLWKIFGPYPALFYSYFTVYCLRPLSRVWLVKYFVKILQIFMPYIDLPDHRWALLDTFDSVTPSNQRGHTHYEVYNWFNRKGFENIHPTDWWGPSLAGTKK